MRTRRRTMVAGLACAFFLASAPCRADDVPWLKEVAETDRGLLERLLSPDETARKTAIEQWHEERVASLPEYGPDNFPPLPVDELPDEVDPNDAFAVRKQGMMAALVVALEKGSVEQRVAASLSIQALAPASMGVIDALTRALADNAPEVRSTVIRTMRGVTPFSGGRYVYKKLPDLVARIEDESPDVRREALWAVGTMIRYGHGDHALRRRAVALAVRASGDEASDVRTMALHAAAAMSAREDPGVLNALTKGLDDPAPDVRTAAAQGLGRLGASSHVALPRLYELLGDDTFEVRYAAADALWSLSGDSKGLMPVMIEALSRLGGNDLAMPARVLTSIGPPAERATPALIRAIGQLEHARHQVTGLEVFEALYSIGPSAEVALPALEAEFLRRPPEKRYLILSAAATVYADREKLGAWIRRMLVEHPLPENARGLPSLLAGLGLETPEVLAWCRKRLSSDDAWERRSAARDLERIGSPSTLNLLLAHLADGKIRRDVLEAIPRIGPRARGAWPLMLPLLHDIEYAHAAAAAIASIGGGEDETMSRITLTALEAARGRAEGREAVALCDAVRAFGGEAGPCVEQLTTFLDDEDESVRGQAASAIGRWGLEASKALPRLQRMLKEGNAWSDGLAAALAAWQVGGPAKPALEHLIHATKYSHPPDITAITALGAMGELAAEAVPLLTQAALHWRGAFWKEEQRTIAALDALGAIGAKAAPALPVIRELERNSLFTKAARRAIGKIDGAATSADEE